MKKVLSGLLIIPVRFYQYAISPFTPAACRHIPSCSEYAVQALKLHGPGTGGLLALNRIGRCNPWGTSGFDPVPKILIKKMNLKKYNLTAKKAPYFDLLKSKLVGILLLLISIFAGACQSGRGAAEKSDTPKVLVSISPYKYFVEKIAGDKVEILVLIPPGTTPHIYDPTPRQMAEISNVDLYFYNGNLGFENAWLLQMQDAYPKLKTIRLNRDIALMEGADDHDDNLEEHDHQHGGVDPHTWLSPANGLIIARNVFEALSDYYPQNRETFEKNYRSLQEEIKNLDKEIGKQLLNLKSRKFMIFHPSLTYFAHDYSLEQIPVEFEGKEPSPAHLKASIDLAKKDGLKIILIQKEFDVENARIISEEIGGEIMQIDPLSQNWAENLLDISKKIKLSSQ